VLAISGKSLHDIFSSLDDLKIPVVDDFVRPSRNDDGGVFKRALDAYCGGQMGRRDSAEHHGVIAELRDPDLSITMEALSQPNQYASSASTRCRCNRVFLHRAIEVVRAAARKGWRP
jgi:hypothetical protein